MKRRFAGFAFLAGAVSLGAASAQAASSMMVTIDCSSIRAIQTYNVGESAVDDTYLLVTGMADGKPVDERFPKSGAWPAAPKKDPVNDKHPQELWKGELENGHFVLLTVTLMQGKGEDQARNKEFLDKLNEADQKVWTSKELASDDDLKKLMLNTDKADQGVITKIKDIYSREKKTDHYGGQFTLVVWNHDGKLTKRLDPVGLTFGEHNGNDIKIYSKLKNTRNNVLSRNEKGQWEELQFEPTSDDSTEVRVKELETEWIPQVNSNPIRHVTDYLVGIEVFGQDGKAVSWNPEDQQNNEDQIHVYWNYAD